MTGTDEVADLIAYLRERLDEEEALANAANSDGARLPWGDLNLKPVPPEDWGDLVEGYLGGEVGEHCACWTPLRVLAEIAAKRTILDLLIGMGAGQHGGDDACGIGNDWDHNGGMDADGIARALAQPYASHADFDPAWRL